MIFATTNQGGREFENLAAANLDAGAKRRRSRRDEARSAEAISPGAPLLSVFGNHWPVPTIRRRNSNSRQTDMPSSTPWRLAKVDTGAKRRWSRRDEGVSPSNPSGRALNISSDQQLSASVASLLCAEARWLRDYCGPLCRTPEPSSRPCCSSWSPAVSASLLGLRRGADRRRD